MTVVIRNYLDDERRQVFDYDGGTAVIYVGKAHPSTLKSEAGWQIRKFSYSGSLITEINFASGTSNFDKVWNDRATYDYTPDS